MCKVCITGNGFQFDIKLEPTADFVGCLMTGAIAALPCFLEAFTKCLAGAADDPDGAYKPGTRIRCS